MYCRFDAADSDCLSIFCLSFVCLVYLIEHVFYFTHSLQIFNHRFWLLAFNPYEFERDCNLEIPVNTTTPFYLQLYHYRERA